MKTEKIIAKINELVAEIDYRKNTQNIGYKKVTYIGLMKELINLFEKAKVNQISIDYKELYSFIWESKEYMKPLYFWNSFTIIDICKKINNYCDEFGYDPIRYTDGKIVA